MQGHYPVLGFRHPEAALVPAGDDVCAILTSIRKAGDARKITTQKSSFCHAILKFAFSRVFFFLAISKAVRHVFTRCEKNLELPTPDVDTSLDETTLQGLISGISSAYQSSATVPGHSHTPPLVGGPPSSFNEHAEFRREHQREIFCAVDVSDHLMIRGFGRIDLRGGMLFAHDEFTESAGMSLWVAMEASLEIVKRVLRADGIDSPSARDAGEFLDDAFESEWESDGYFADYYEDRIKTIHPASRYGVYPGPCLSHDDVWDLGVSLIPVYDFLVTGHVPKELKGR